MPEPNVEQLIEVPAAVFTPDIPPMPRYLAIGFVRDRNNRFCPQWCCTDPLCNTPQDAMKEIMFQGREYETDPSTVRVFEVPEADAEHPMFFDYTTTSKETVVHLPLTMMKRLMETQDLHEAAEAIDAAIERAEKEAERGE